MNREDIIRLAEQNVIVIVGEAMFRFAALVAAAEREACAQVADEIDDMTGREIADSIRARGEA